MTRRRTRARKAAAKPMPKPWCCVVLAVDTAGVSGWAIRAAETQLEFGEVDSRDEAAVERIVRWAIRTARRLGWPVVLVLEAPWGRRTKTVAGLGAARERWERAWRLYGQSDERIVRVQVATWRAAVLGRYWVSAPREEVRTHEQRTAAELVGEDVGADEAPAILIAKWAAYAARTGQAIGRDALLGSMQHWLRNRGGRDDGLRTVDDRQQVARL